MTTAVAGESELSQTAAVAGLSPLPGDKHLDCPERSRLREPDGSWRVQVDLRSGAVTASAMIVRRGPGV